MKKVLALLLVVAMVMGLACMVSAEEVKTYKVGCSIYTFDDNFMTLYRNEIVDYFKTLETDTVKYEITMADGKNDMAEQTNQVRNFITQGMDVIILNLVQTSSADAVIDEVVAAGIPLVLINREPLAYDKDGNTLDEAYEGILDNPTVCYVGADARQSGTFQGQIIAETENKGDWNGNGVVDYVMIMGGPENVDAQYRTQFSIKALEDAGLKVNKLFEQRGDWDQTKGQELAATALTQFGNDVDVIFCNNDAMALGAYQAIADAGRTVGQDIALLGVDALAECVEMVNEGKMTGTVLNDHNGQSHAAADAALKAAAGETLEKYYWVDYVMVTK